MLAMFAATIARYTPSMKPADKRPSQIRQEAAERVTQAMAAARRSLLQVHGVDVYLRRPSGLRGGCTGEG